MDKVFADSDICLDVLTQRHPHYYYSAAIFDLAHAGKLNIFVSAVSFTNLFYLLKRQAGAAAALQGIRRLKILVTVLAVTDKIIDAALNSYFSDFEDAVQYYTAMQGGIKTIITRNVKDYKTADCVVLTPEIYLRSFETR